MRLLQISVIGVVSADWKCSRQRNLSNCSRNSCAWSLDCCVMGCPDIPGMSTICQPITRLALYVTLANGANPGMHPTTIIRKCTSRTDFFCIFRTFTYKTASNWLSSIKKGLA